MKKLISILGFFFGLGFIVCLIIGFCNPIPAEVVKKSQFAYKLLCGVGYFLNYIPAILTGGFVISLSVHFGHNSEGSTSRFSKAMYERYKLVIITALSFSFILTLSNETFGILVNQGKQKIINRPKLINEYIKVGNDLFENGFYDRAMRYADAALKLEPNSREASNLKDKTNVEINKTATSNVHFKLYETAIEKATVDHVLINADQISEVYELYKKAQNAYDNEEWFNAHYYAEMGINLATPKDPNLKILKNISNDAWKNLTEHHKLNKTEDQLSFDKKYEGYLALHQKDDLKAYYIFHELSQTSRQLATDPDVIFYLDVAEKRIREKYFFIDETFEQKSFENANDVYFSFFYKDGTRDVVYVKGVTTVKETGNTIQYLRDLTIETFLANGELYRTMTVPYAKVLPVSVQILNETVRELMEIDEKTKSIPYLLLSSVSRDNAGLKIEPEYTFSDGRKESFPQYLVLPISFDDFIMLESNTKSPETIDITKLVTLSSKANQYGYSDVIYGQALINRLLYPILILIIMILIATFAWHNRIGATQYFKLSWVFSFPFIIAICWVFYLFLYYLFKLVNFVFIEQFGISTGILVGLIFYIFLWIFVSIYFLSRHSKQ